VCPLSRVICATNHHYTGKDMRFHTAAAALIAVLLVPGLTVTSLGVEIVVQNDRLVDNSTAAVQAGFVAGESAAAWLTSPCDGNIVAVQILWRSQFGGAGQSIEDSITIFDVGTFPQPGAQLELLEGPVLTDGVLNEFRFLDENMTIPLSVPVSTGQTFVVSLRFFNTPGVFGASVTTDTNGCQAGRNAINASPGGWLNLCSFGASGDFVIRAVVDCPSLPGACCLSDGMCVPNQSEDDCDMLGGTFQGAETTCAVPCPEPEGACCVGGNCIPNTPLSTCEGAAGFFAGDGATCPDACQVGACCIGDGTCEQLFAAECTDMGGVFQGAGQPCEPNPCPQPEGACCFGGVCFPNQLEADCLALDPPGVWQGPGSLCKPDPCQSPCPAADGDLNDDTRLDGVDARLFVAAILGTPTQDEICAGDFNENGELDAGDVADFANALVNAP